MAEQNELKQIKKIYGEKFMHLCRRLFPTILEHEGVLLKILQSSFAGNSRTLGEDITEELEEEFKNFIFSKIDVDKEKPEIITNKTPYELLEEAGYDLYECTSEEEIQNFKKYYKPGEELCTFNGRRLDRCLVFWAVKKGAKEIKRENFLTPKREDEYGTSVISIQFSKGNISTVSIKNRYNHTVNNPDATYGNKLDRIIPGLTQSFTELLAKRGMELNTSNVEDFEIPNYTVANDGKYYKYNMEINGYYYCPGNIIIDGEEVIHLKSEKQVLIDYFILDKEHKTLRIYDTEQFEAFQDFFLDHDIQKIEMKKNDEKEKGARIIIIHLKDCATPVEIQIDKDNNITGYKNEELTEVGGFFLYDNIKLTRLDLPNLKKTEDSFLYFNEDLQEVNLLNLRTVGNYFLFTNQRLNKLQLPNLIQVGDGFLSFNEQLSKLELPNLVEVGNGFLKDNRGLSKLELPNLKVADGSFIRYNENLSQISLPKLTKVGGSFLVCNKGLSQLELPNLTKAGAYFFRYNENIRQIKLPNLKKIGDSYFVNNEQARRNILHILEINNNRQAPVGKIDAKEIIELDKQSELTSTEIEQGKAIIENTNKEEKSQSEK